MNRAEPTPPNLPALRSALMDHYDREARDLPWRRDTDPYRVLVSEVMLQQTRVETVIGYYDRWLERFPSLDALAKSDEDDVLKAWEGLGYYRRARNLRRAARVVRESHGGVVPTTYDGLRSLPGVGAYTAGAVASIAFGRVVPAVDGNVRRVLARLHDEAEPSASWLEEEAGKLVDRRRPGDWNQAVMELGATVCAPRAPECDDCPLTPWCRAHAHGTQSERPARKRRGPVAKRRVALAVLYDGDRVLVCRRPTDGLLGGMWAFPEAECPSASRSIADGVAPGGSPGDGAGHDSHGTESLAHRDGSLALQLAASFDLEPVGEPEALPECRHRFTHLEAVYEPWAVAVRARRGGKGRAHGRGIAWLDPHEPGALALPRAQQRVLRSFVDRGVENP